VDTILVLKFEWGQRGQAVLRFEWKSGWDQTGKLELASTLTFGFVNPAGTEPYRGEKGRISTVRYSEDELACACMTHDSKARDL